MTEPGKTEEPAAGKNPEPEDSAQVEDAKRDSLDEASADAGTAKQDSSGEVSADAETAKLDEASADAETVKQDSSEEASADAEGAKPDSSDEVSSDAESSEEPVAAGGRSKKGLFVGLGGGLLVGAVAGLAFAGLVKPDFLVGPGKPDDTASAVTTALAGKDASGLAASSCRSPDGTLAPQLPQQALQLIQGAEQSEPPRRSLDSEALIPVNLTLSVQGQTQTVPIDVVLGVTDGKWCMKGIADQQQ